MAFSFGAGNVAKLARIPFYLVGRLATVLVPRTNDLWVFGCGIGIGDGALALWNVAHDQGVRAIWLVGTTQDEAEAQERGIPHLRKHSARGFWATARARVVVVTHGFGDVNRYALNGAYIVQLWHGIPLKRIGIDSPATVRVPAVPGAGLLRRLITLFYTQTTRSIDLIPAASHLVRGRLESAFSLPDSAVPVTGEPRVDVLSQGDADQRRSHARAAIGAVVGGLPSAVSRLVLYAPTWRDGDRDPAVPSLADWASIATVLNAQDAVLLIRSHPLGAGDYTPSPDLARTGRVRSLGSDLVRDATPLLPGLDALVSDYSSMAFDASLVSLPVVFFAPDVDSYTADRGFYGTYEEVAGADYATSWPEVADQLSRILSDSTERTQRAERSDHLSTRVHAFRDGRNALRVYERIAQDLHMSDPVPGRQAAPVVERKS